MLTATRCSPVNHLFDLLPYPPTWGTRHRGGGGVTYSKK